MPNTFLEKIEYKIEETAMGTWMRYGYENGTSFHEFRSHLKWLGFPFIHYTYGRNPETGRRVCRQRCNRHRANRLRYYSYRAVINRIDFDRTISDWDFVWLGAVINWSCCGRAGGNRCLFRLRAIRDRPDSHRPICVWQICFCTDWFRGKCFVDGTQG